MDAVARSGGAESGGGDQAGSRNGARRAPEPHKCARLRRGAELDEDATIGAFVHAAQLGLFDMSWSALCPGCGGVLETGAALKTLDRSEYFCSLCVGQCEPTLDELVEVTFTVSPRVRRIAAHDPDSLRLPGYTCARFSGARRIELPDDFEQMIEEHHARRARVGARREGDHVADAAGGQCAGVRSGHPHVDLPRRRRRGDARAAQRCRSCSATSTPKRHDEAAAGAGAHRASKTARARRTLPGVWAPGRGVPRDLSAPPARSSRRRACSATRRSARSIATARSIPSSASRSPT